MSHTYGSVCSGIEAVSVAWESLGFFTPAWFSENDRAASELLAERWPDVVNLGDMTSLPARVASGEIEAPDILVGGTPCQAFSLAGRRLGFADVRGQLTLSFVDLADAIDQQRAADGDEPCVVVWENVPGVLSHKDNPFGCFLAGLAGEDAPLRPPGKRWGNAGVVLGPQRTIAWRTLDAQFFGLAQRRRRVFVVASARDGFDPGDLLLEFEGVRRDSAPRRETGEAIAGTLDARAAGGGFPGTQGACEGHVVPAERCGLDGIAFTLRVPHHGASWRGDGADNLVVVEAFGGNNQAGPIDVATARSAHGGPHGRLDFESETFVVQPTLYSIMPMNSGKDYKARAVDVAQPLMAAGPVGGNQGGDYIVQSVALRGRDEGATAELGGDLAHALRASGGGGDKPHVLAPVHAFDARQQDVIQYGDLTGPLDTDGHSIAIAFSCKDHGADASPEMAPTLRAMGHSGSHANAGGQVAVCVTGEITHTLKADGFDGSEDGSGRGQPITVTHMAVRRLMPVECERLQGFPDGHTAILKGNRWTADGPRYKQIGNSMAVNVMRWIGRRLADALAPKPAMDWRLIALLLID